MTETKFLKKLRETGWLAAVPEAEAVRIRTTLPEFLAQDARTAFLALAVTRFDPECISGSGPDEPCSYHSVISQLAKASYGQFAPVDLEDEFDFDAERVRISFRHAEQQFATAFPQRDDWFQEQALDLINRALVARKVKARFLVLPPEDQIAWVALIPPAVYKKAVGAGFVPRKPLFDL